MFWQIQAIIALSITFYFIVRERPKLYFLFLGYLFFLIALILSIPIKYLEFLYGDYLKRNLIPFFVISFVLIVIPIFTKYFSLKKYLKTKSYKNGILFGLGWATIESIDYFKILFFTYIFSYFSFEFDYTYLLGGEYTFFVFLFLFVLNIATTVLIVISIIKERIWYFLYSIFLMTFSLFFINFFPLESQLYIYVFVFFYCLYTLFYYRNIV